MFWCITIGIVLIAGVDQGLYQHTMLYLTEHAGLTTRVAAAALSVTFALSIISKFIAGRFFDRFSIKGIALWYVLVALVVLLAFPVQGLVTAVVFTCARGIAHGGLISESPVIAKHCYGPRFMDKVMPILSGCWTIGSAVGPVGLALLYDNTGGYVWGFVLFVAIALTAAATLALFVRPLYRDRLRMLQAMPDTAHARADVEGLKGERA
jgi:MFS family permease